MIPTPDELLRRIDGSGAVDLTQRANEILYRDLVEGLGLGETHRLELHPRSYVDPERRSVILRAAVVERESDHHAATVEWRVDGDSADARLEYLGLMRGFDGQRLGLRLLRSAIEALAPAGYKSVTLYATLECGSWYWAEVGFDFASGQDARDVREWVGRVTAAFGDRVDVSRYRPVQLAGLWSEYPVSLAEVEERVGTIKNRRGIEAIAAANHMEPQTPMRFGKAVMLTGPGWEGRLDLDANSFSRQSFDDYARRRLGG